MHRKGQARDGKSPLYLYAYGSYGAAIPDFFASDRFSLADRGLMVILPEPTSVENCYRFLRAAFLRRLYHLGRTLGHQPIIDLVMEHRDQADDGRPYEIIEEIARVDSCVAATLASHVDTFLPHLVINQVRSHEDERLGESMEWIANRFVRIPMRFAGAIPYDPTLVQCVKTRRAYLSEYPRTRTAEMLRAVSESFSLPRSGPVSTPGRRTPERDAYQALDLRPGAMQDEILTAYMRLRRALRSDSPALASLDCEVERQATVAAIEEAYRSLSRNLSAPALRRRGPVRSSVPLL